jgi:uncharacterized protein (TIGR02270 family)
MATALQPVWRLVRESFREAEFLWARWQDALDSPSHTLDDVAFWVERRLAGAIDGVALGGPRALETILMPALFARRDRRATVAAHIAVGMGAEAVVAVARALRNATPQRVDALRRGIECSTDERGLVLLLRYLAELPGPAQAALLEALAFRRAAPPQGLDALIDRDHADVRRSALRLAATRPEDWADAYIRWGLAQPEAIAVEAARAGLLRGMSGTSIVAQRLVAAGAHGSDELLTLLGLAGGDAALRLVMQRLDRGDRCRHAFEALACIGTVEAADACAARLEHPEQGTLAADALRAIAGIDGPAEEALEQAWTRGRDAFRPRTRYAHGRPFEPRALPSMLETVTTRRRHALASDLARRTRGKVQVATTTWTTVQRGQLASARTLAS